MFSAVMAHNRHNLKILSWNCQSIRKKVSELHDYINKADIDIVTLSETWISNNQALNLQNYTIYRRDRQHSQHGGVAIAIKQNISHSLMPHITTNIIESIGLHIKLKNSSTITVVSCYFTGQDIKTLTSLTTGSYFLT